MSLLVVVSPIFMANTKMIFSYNFVAPLNISQHSGLQIYQKETLAQVFSCEFCEISKTTLFNRTPPLAASDQPSKRLTQQLIIINNLTD